MKRPSTALSPNFTSDPAQAKKCLRQQLLSQREQLTREDWQIQSHALCQRLAQQSWFQTAQTIFAYFSFRQEPDLKELWRSHPDKAWVFPRCTGPSLEWHHWRVGEPLISGAYGIQEPKPTAPAIAPQQADLILVPAVSCDFSGHRLGYGGGYYDRTLALPGMAQICKVGIVFDVALLSELPQEPWDCPLDAVCSEARWMEQLSERSLKHGRQSP